jgi:hypothetical protein
MSPALLNFIDLDRIQVCVLGPFSSAMVMELYLKWPLKCACRVMVKGYGLRKFLSCFSPYHPLDSLCLHFYRDNLLKN